VGQLAGDPQLLNSANKNPVRIKESRLLKRIGYPPAIFSRAAVDQAQRGSVQTGKPELLGDTTLA
jgi:hypothetical protein